MVRSAILVVLLLGFGYSNGFIAGMSPLMGNMGGMGAMGNLMMAGALNGGSQSDMMKMMTMMSLMNPSTPSGTGGATETTTNPLVNGMLKMGLCRSIETNDSPLCTPALCSIKGQLRYANPNMYECIPGFGCCYKDHQSMLFGKMLN